MKAYTTLTGISKLNDMVIEGQNQSVTFRISIIPTYANRCNCTKGKHCSKKITLSEQNKSMLADDEFTLTATVEPTDATEEIDWSVTPSDLLAVS